ncbi:hypothetical protein BRADI_1g43603v3, partial [Brachypodium distachyon]
RRRTKKNQPEKKPRRCPTCHARYILLCSHHHRPDLSLPAPPPPPAPRTHPPRSASSSHTARPDPPPPRTGARPGGARTRPSCAPRAPPRRSSERRGGERSSRANLPLPRLPPRSSVEGNARGPDSPGAGQQGVASGEGRRRSTAPASCLAVGADGAGSGSLPLARWTLGRRRSHGAGSPPPPAQKTFDKNVSASKATFCERKRSCWVKEVLVEPRGGADQRLGGTDLQSVIAVCRDKHLR